MFLENSDGIMFQTLQPVVNQIHVCQVWSL